MKFGTHSDTHPHVNNLNYGDNVTEIINSSRKIEDITGNKVRLYRPPYGEYNNTVIQAGEENGYYCIQWSLDTLDYKGLDGGEMWNRLNGKIKPGDIILMHNGTEHTADSLDKIIYNIKEEGFDLVTVSELMYKENYYINNNGTQILKTKS